MNPGHRCFRSSLQSQARSVPNLVGEVPAHFNSLRAEAHVLHRTHVAETEASGVRSILINEIQGSTPVPRLLLIRRPSGARIVGCIITSSKGISPAYSKPIIIILDTHRKIISLAVESTEVG